MSDIKDGKISIIIPVYNIQDYLDNNLKSVVNQSYKNLEIILVNDGSTDGSEKKCCSWSEKDSRVRLINKENGGVGSARNIGLKNCTGDYILFLDGDDEIASDMCEKLLQPLISYKADVSYCGFFNIFEDKTENNIPVPKVLTENEIISELITEVSFFTAVWNKLFKKSVLLDKNGSYIEFPLDIYIGEDALWLSKVLKNARKVVSVPEALYYWKRRATSATQGSSEIRIDEKYLSVVQAHYLMLQEIDDELLKKTVYKKYLGLCRDCMIQAYLKGNSRIEKQLLSRIKTDIKQYGRFDFFRIKMWICIMSLKMHFPIGVIKKIQYL